MSDATILLVALDAIENVLEAGEKLSLNFWTSGGIDGMENLQERPNEEEVYQMAIKILGDIYPLRKMATTKTWHQQ